MNRDLPLRGRLERAGTASALRRVVMATCVVDAPASSAEAPAVCPAPAVPRVEPVPSRLRLLSEWWVAAGIVPALGGGALRVALGSQLPQLVLVGDALV